MMSHRTSGLGRTSLATAHQHPVSAALVPLRLRTSTQRPAPISAACTATPDAPATSGPTDSTPPDASDAAPAVFPSRKQRGAELQTPKLAAAGKRRNRLNLRKKVDQGYTRPVLAPLPEKLITCAIQRSRTWQQQADVYARNHTVMNGIHVAAMLAGAANAMKALEVRSRAVAKAAATLDARNKASGSGSASTFAAVAAVVNARHEISADNFVPYANAPASLHALLVVLEADTLRMLPSMGSRTLSNAVWGATNAWSLASRHGAGSGKDAAWTGPSVEFLEALGVATSRNIAEFNPQDLCSVLNCLGKLRKESYPPMSKALGPTNPIGVALRTDLLQAVHKALPSVSSPIAVANIAMGLANLRYSPGTPLLLELQSASMRVLVPAAGEHPEVLSISNTLWGLALLVGPQRRAPPSSAAQQGADGGGSSPGSEPRKAPQPIVSAAFLQAMAVAALAWHRRQKAPPAAPPAATQRPVSLLSRAARQKVRHATWLASRRAQSASSDADGSGAEAVGPVAAALSPAPAAAAAAPSDAASKAVAAAASCVVSLPAKNWMSSISSASTERNRRLNSSMLLARTPDPSRLTLGAQASPQLAQNLFWALSRLNYPPAGQMPQLLQDWSRQVLFKADSEALALLIGSLAAFQVQQLDPEWLAEFSDSAAGKVARARPEPVVRMLGALSRLRVSHVDARLSEALWRHVRTHVGSTYQAADIMFLVLASEGAWRHGVEGSEEGMRVDDALEQSAGAASGVSHDGGSGSVRLWAPASGVPWNAIAAAWDAGKGSESVSERLGARVEAVLSRIRDFALRSARHQRFTARPVRRSSTHVTHASSEYQTLQGYIVTRVSDDSQLPLLSLVQPAPGSKVVIAFLTHFADLTSWEYAQKLVKILPTLQAQGVDLIAVGLGSTASAQEFARILDFPLDRLFADPDGSMYRTLGFSPGFGADMDISAYAKLLPMLAGIGSPGTFQEVIRGYMGDRDSKAVFDQATPFDVLGTGYQRPFELATLRLFNMVGILPKWGSLSPAKESLLTQQGGTIAFQDANLLFRHDDSGILKYTDVNELLRVLEQATTPLALPLTAASVTVDVVSA
ncbi:MAG: hypothetical protein WDW36_008265 [Sanguina aurantia]